MIRPISVSQSLSYEIVKLCLHTHTRLTALGLPGGAGTTKVKTNLDFTEARESEWQWHQLGYMQVCTSRVSRQGPHTHPFNGPFYRDYADEPVPER